MTGFKSIDKIYDTPLGISSSALLDSEGVIVEVNNAWKRFADTSGLALAGYGVGSNYLKYCIYPDPASRSVLQGLRNVISHRTDAFAIIYPCHSPQRKRWFLMLSFAIAHKRASALAMHIDISPFLTDRPDPSVHMVGTGVGSDTFISQTLATIVRKAVADALSERQPPQSSAPHDEDKRLRRLTRHQLGILADVATGATNAEIAAKHEIAIGSVKSQVATIIHKLDLSNRTQAALFAASRGIGGYREPKP